MSYKTRDGKTHQTHVLLGENGLPVDSIATISGSYIFLADSVNPISYSGGTVTLPVGHDLTPVTTARARYTGKYVLVTLDNRIYYIDRQSINIGARTFVISTSDKVQVNPASVDLSAGWVVAEADIVNRLATTSSAKIDHIEFRDMQFQFELDGDPVTLLNSDGEEVNPATEDTLQEINDKLANDYGDSSEALRTASQIGSATGPADFGSGFNTAQTLRTSSNTMGINPNGEVTPNKESGKVDSNSTVTPLLAGQTFTGDWVDASQYSCISWTVNADVDSAVSGMRLQFSHDASNIIRQSATNFTGAANGVFFSFPVHARYFRLYYENGAVNQTRFYLDTQLHEEYNGLAAVPLDTPLNDKSSATTVKSIISGKTVDGVYVNQRASGVSTLNSTTTLLSAAATYIGTFEDVVGYSTIAISVYSNVDSTTDGLVAEFSSDGVNVDHQDFYTVRAGEGNQLTFGVLAKYFRIRFINGGSAQATFRLSTLYNLSATQASSIRIDDTISGQNDAALTKAVSTGKNPDGDFVNSPVQGSETVNSYYTPLDANSIFRGEWRRWASDYLTLVSTVSSDVAGTLYIDSSDDPAPINGSDASITYSAASEFDPAEVAALRRNTPVQSLWVRHRYINGPAAQTFISLNAIFTVSDPGSVYLPARQIPHIESLSAVTRGITTIPTADGEGFQDLPVDSITGDPKVTVQTIRDDILLKPMNLTQVEQGVVSITPVRIDPSPLPNRRIVNISNDGSTNCGIGFSSSISYSSASFVLKGGKERDLPLDSSVELWAVAENAGGVIAVLNRTGTTTAGTATNPGNTLLSDNTYTNIVANSQTATVEGFTAGTANPLVSVKLGVEGKKQSGQFETVAFVDVVTGTAGNTGNVVSGSVTANILYKYLVGVTWKTAGASITGVTGMGATWTLVTSSSTADSTTAVYINTTSTTSTGAVTVTFSAVSGGSVIGVSRYSGVNLTSPVQISEALFADPATSSYSDSINGTDKGLLVTMLGIKDRTHTVGSSATERTETTSAGDATLVVNTLALTSTASIPYSGTLSGNTRWTLVALTLSPATAVDPRITLSYELSAVPGATSDLVTFTSTSDSTTLVDITGDRSWVVGDIANIKAIATGTLISAASADIDQLYVEVTDSTGNSTRISVLQLGRSF